MAGKSLEVEAIYNDVSNVKINRRINLLDELGTPELFLVFHSPLGAFLFLHFEKSL